MDVLDIWSHHTPWPVNQSPKSYSFLVKHAFLWRATFTATQPRLVHVPTATATAAFAGRHLAEAFEQYDPDLVVSVHPLMQVRGGRQGWEGGVAVPACLPVWRAPTPRRMDGTDGMIVCLLLADAAPRAPLPSSPPAPCRLCSTCRCG